MRSPRHTILIGDCRKVLATLPDNSVHAIVTDPPYELGFMGKKWDSTGIAYDPIVWSECLRVLKPGGFLLAFSATRTHHRMACAIEDAGFEIRDMIAWAYGCLDEKTQVATVDGVKPYHKTKIGDLVLCYDVKNKEYSYQPILEVVEYEYNDTAYRLIGDFGEQVVSRNHRVIIERSGKEVFQTAESIALEQQASVPILEDLPILQKALSNNKPHASAQKKNMYPQLHKKTDRHCEYWQNATRAEKGANNKLRRLQYAGMKASCLVKEGEKPDVQPSLQWYIEGQRLGETRKQGAGKLAARIKTGANKTDDWQHKPSLEGRRHISEKKRVVCKSTNKIYTLSKKLSFNGEEGRLCYGTPLESGSNLRESIRAGRGCSPYKPRRYRQQNRKFNAISFKFGSQKIRTWAGHKSAMVRVVPFQYTGKVWCLRVPTGAFVAVRNGVAFPTGNSGFPKALDISKAIDSHLGATREKVRLDVREVGNLKARQDSRPFIEEAKAKGFHEVDSDEAVTDDAKHWGGWKTALKPALEPICMARKPLEGTYAENVLTHGVGGLNIDGCRIGTGDKTETNPKGRFPANLIHDGSDEVLALFPETGKAKAAKRGLMNNGMPLGVDRKENTNSVRGHNDNGGSAARFFYTAKATKEDREAGTAMLALKTLHRVNAGGLENDPKFAPTSRRNNHPTVKPTELMRYLCRLVTPVDGVVLDPFMGSGSTGRGAILEGFDFIGIELSPEYAEIAVARINDAYSFTPDVEIDGHGQVVEQLKLGGA